MPLLLPLLFLGGGAALGFGLSSGVDKVIKVAVIGGAVFYIYKRMK